MAKCAGSKQAQEIAGTTIGRIWTFLKEPVSIEDCRRNRGLGRTEQLPNCRGDTLCYKRSHCPVAIMGKDKLQIIWPDFRTKVMNQWADKPWIQKRMVAGEGSIQTGP